MICVYTPGTKDRNGVVISATEARNLKAYNGALFLGTGRWMDTPDFPAQILRLDAEGGEWVVEWTGVQWEQAITALFPAHFPQAGVTKFMASLWGDSRTHVLTRNDATRTWTDTIIRKDTGGAQIRCFATHTDKVTKVDMVFAGQAPAGILAGRLVNGSIVWNATPELTVHARPMSFAVQHGNLYVSVFESIYMREDGATPTWTLAGTNPNPGTVSPGCSGLRGMIASPFKDGTLWTANTGSNCGILSFNPVTKVWKTLYDFPGEGGIAGYNEINFFNGTVYVGYQCGGAGYLTSTDGVNWTRNAIPASVIPGRTAPLVAVRTIEQSPFNPAKIYFGGYDCDNKPSRNTAWVTCGP